MPNWINIKNESSVFVGDFGVAYGLAFGTQYIELGQITIGTSESYRCQDKSIPEGVICWVYKNIPGSNSKNQSESNFICDYNDSQTAAYNSGVDGFSLNIEPN
jgi:hypothetical protein